MPNCRVMLSFPGGFTLDFVPVVTFPVVFDFACDDAVAGAFADAFADAFDLVFVFAFAVVFVVVFAVEFAVVFAFVFDFAGTFPLVSATPGFGAAASAPANTSINAQVALGAGRDERDARIFNTDRNAATTSIDDDTIRDSVIASISEQNKQWTQSRNSTAPRLGPPVRAG